MQDAAMKRVVEKEQFFTHPALAARCVDYAADVLDLSAYTHVVEPSAGEGSFLRLLPEDRRIGLDLEPRHDDVERADFLRWQPPTTDGAILTIGNPPFGQRASLAFAFLQRACAFSDAVAFILPRSFNKYTFQNRVDPRFHLVGRFDCDEPFAFRGRRHRVKTVFQVWKRGEQEREQIVLPDTHPDFDLSHRHLSRVSEQELRELRTTYAFTVPQVGANFAPREAVAVTKGSHWFVRPHAPEVRARFERLDFGFLDGMNTAHTSLSRRDIVAAYEHVLAGESRCGASPDP